MANNLRTVTRSSLSFLLAAVFLYIAFRNANFSDLWTSLLGASYGWLLLLIPVGLLSHWVRALRWQFLLVPLKPRTSVRNLFSAVMIGYLVNNVLPRAGELVRPYVLGKLEGISRSAALGTVIVERVLDLLTFAFMLCAVLFFYPSALDAFVEDVESVRYVFLAGSLLSCILLVILFLKTDSLFRLLRVFGPLVPQRYAPAVQSAFESFLSGVGVGRVVGQRLAIVLLSLAVFFLYAVALWIGFFMVPTIAAMGLDLGAAVILLTVSTVAFALPAPGAMGTYHSFLTFAMVNLWGVDGVSALSYVIITHEVGYLTNTVVGFGYLMKDRIRLREVRAARTSESTGVSDETGNPSE